ncbi:DUF1501 domain-containing protein [Stieleria varia]|uniref:Sulfatase n=1 Tax=Stieleria varia TaxID=2528005 RepID=A0A5C6B4F5_9BACT|nr:DUF1501 domain-containing protein [Stieleria varia]TWU06452.1 hypothetical protein Pla52n_21730 [Stieleria varia]
MTTSNDRFEQSRLLCNASAHLSRRTLLGAGGGSLMMSILASRLARADERGETDPAKPKSVILVWLEGGPSQLETFDPHAGTKIGGEVTAIETSVKGLQIADTLPHVAQYMHLGSLVRSVTGKEGDHERAIYNVRTGFRPDPTLIHPGIGAALCQATSDGLDIPRHVSIFPGQFASRGGFLGAAYDPFKINDPGGSVPDVRSYLEPDRFDRRIEDIALVEKQFAAGRLRDLDRSRTLHQTATTAALKMMSSDQLDAFDVTNESATVQESFGDTPFGRGCLAAARLIEVGVRCVEVTLTGWDSHVANHSLQSSSCKVLDVALASLLARLQERDMLDHTLVVCGGEFGRTPKINAAEGRDHWPHGFSTFLAGCGIRQGHVHGATASDPDLESDRPLDNVAEPVTVGDLHATILKSVGVPFDEELDTPIGRPMKRSDGQPIQAILA